VLQPLAVKLSEFLQTEGLDRLGEIGTRIGEITQSIIDLFMTPETKTTFISDIIEDEAGNVITVMDTIIKPAVFKSFDEVAAGVQNRIALWWAGIDWDAIGQGLEDALIKGIESIDWNRIGLEFNTAMSTEFTTDLGSTELDSALGNAFSQLIVGAFGYISWDALKVDFAEGVEYMIVDIFGYIRFEDLAADFVNGFRTIGQQIAAAFGYYGWDAWNNLWTDFQLGWNYTLTRIKTLLGISSPSTVFSGLARDLVQGLINGWNSLFDNFLSAVSGGIDDILDLFAPILALFGVDVGSGGGSTGGGSGTHDGSGGTTSGGSVVNNYYGPVYFQGGTEPGSYYDCPSPNPLVASSGNQLVATGF